MFKVLEIGTFSYSIREGRTAISKHVVYYHHNTKKYILKKETRNYKTKKGTMRPKIAEIINCIGGDSVTNDQSLSTDLSPTKTKCPMLRHCL